MHYRSLIAKGVLEFLFERLDQAIKDAGYLPMSGQVVDASLMVAPRQRNTQDEKDAIKAGKSADQIWSDNPAKTAQKDTDARWSMKISKGKVDADGKPQPDIAIPAFGYKSYISIDVRHGFIRRQMVTDAAAYDGARLREGLIDRANTASSIWADTAYDQWPTKRSWPAPARPARSTERSRGIDRCQSTMPERFKVRARAEHVFGNQKDRMNLMLRSIGIKRAEATIIMVNIAYNLGRWRWWHGRTVTARQKLVRQGHDQASNAARRGSR